MEKNQRKDPVKFGSMVSVNDKIGISHLERFAAYGLGNYVNLKIHWHRDTQVTRPTIEKAVRFCVENKIYFSFSEFLDRYTYTPWKILDTLTRQDWIELQALGKEYCLGCHTICERGGAVYWPLGYKHDSLLLPRAANMKEASEFYMAGIKKALETERFFGRENLECIDSSFLHKYHFQAGMDGAAIEMFPGNCDRMYPAVRGASRGYGKETFGVDVAGYPTIVVLILLVGGIQLFALGIIGEYLGRSYMETKNRPVYFIRDIYTNKTNKPET